ncbi:MAG: GTP-binding protein [Myxococcota bacterium]
MSVTLNVVTGILGAGKTTTLRHLVEGKLGEGTPAVVVGEFAEQGFDADMLRASGAYVVQFSGGPLSGQADAYVSGVRALVESGNHARVFLETSGVTHISAVAKRLAADPVIARDAVFGRTATVLDAGAFLQHAKHFAPQLWGQVRVADIVVVNKTDKVQEADLAEIRDQIRQHNPAAAITFCYMGQVRRQDVLAPLPEDTRAAIVSVDWGDDVPAEFEAFVYTSDVRCFDRVAFGHRLLNLPGGAIARFKGGLRCYDKTHCVNGMPGQLDWDSTPMTGATAIAFIGLGLSARKDAICKVLDDELLAQADDGR